MYQIKKIGLVRPMGNTLRVRPMGNSETNGQHFFEKLVCCPLVSPTVVENERQARLDLFSLWRLSPNRTVDFKKGIIERQVYFFD